MNCESSVEENYSGNTSLRMIDFHVPSGDEIVQINKMQKKRRNLCFIKRMAVIFVIVAICIVFQIIARRTIPNSFSKERTIDRLYVIATIIFLGANMLSWIELMIEDKILFRIKTAEVAYVRVKKKMVCEQFSPYINRFYKEHILVCESVVQQEQNEEDTFFYKETEPEEKTLFILDKIKVSGVFTFSNIKEGSMVYIERVEYDGNYRYHYIA